MGIDSMRVGGGRCPPLLVGGLLLACLMLICNWWTLSSENLELLRQIDELNEQIKISAEERDQCVTLRGNLEQRYKHAEDEIASLHVRLEQEAERKKKLKESENSIALCIADLTSKTAKLEESTLEKDKINVTLEATRVENKRLQEDISKAKEECQAEVNKVKLNCNSPDQRTNYIEPSSKSAKTNNGTANQNEEEGFEEMENDTHMNDASPGVEANVVEENEDDPPPESTRDQLMKAGTDYDKPEEPTN